MPIAIALLIALLFQSIDEVAGAWRGTVMHEGETREVIVEFVRKGEKVLTLFSSPSIHAWRFPYALAERSGNRITAGGMVFELDPSAGTLTTTLAADLVPKYALRVTLHRIDAVVPAERPPIDAPAREPRWTLDLHAPIWADLAVDGDTVFAGAEDGRLHAIDATTGRERWMFTAGGALRASPAFLGGDVIVQADDGVLYRIDGRRGTEKWHVAIAKARTRFGMGDPASRYENFASGVEVDGRRLYVGTHDGRVLSIDARRGAPIWEFKAADAVVATPVAAHGRVYCGSFDGNLYALDAASGALAWKHDTGGAVTSAAAMSGPYVVVGSRSFELQALDAATGAPGWTKYFWFSWVESPANVFESKAYVGSSDAGTVSAIDGGNGRAIWSTDVQGSAWGRPAVTASTVYEGVTGVLHYIAPHRGALVAIDRATGRIAWWYSAKPPDPAPASVTPYGFAGSVAVGRRFVYAGGLDGVLYAFEK
ncbi:MAG TPA: PQQ-binding-like beta-propeller repeat protein [Vicinamibacterales bacterium]|nr:PQQ-binding-like beta-propeller repeat protein [Vicinamibacterales bacterium]